MKLALPLAVLTLAPSAALTAAPSPKRPITLSKSGGFQIGGKTISNPFNPAQTLSCDHGYMEYFLPWRPRKTSLVMWHSSSTQVWQNSWAGGDGYKDMFLRRNYPVYLWDGPRVGRANWACEPTFYTPNFQDQANFGAWNFGPRYPVWWDDVQFPTQDADAWQQATSARYVEYDTKANVELQSDAAAIAADSGRVGTDIVYLTNSAGGLRAMMTATKANGTNIKAIVAYESIGYVFPDNINVTAGTGGFGPFVVPLAQFKKLAELTKIQFVWGDHRAENFTSVVESRRMAALINQYGGNAEVLKLGDDAGLKGSTHIPFADLDNAKVAGLLDDLLEKNGLDGYEDGGDGDDDEDNDWD
ncbi:Nn.00g079300.m01.CDS01 [Neocucurbitaria sp. VM-36]